MKKILKQNIRVEVIPSSYFYLRYTEEDLLRICARIKNEIARHTDNWDSINIVWDSKEFCEFCGAEWEDATDENGVPGCCQIAVDEWEEANGNQGNQIL
jgi:hypothetical protein